VEEEEEKFAGAGAVVVPPQIPSNALRALIRERERERERFQVGVGE
jgi:hypothetical protein